MLQRHPLVKEVGDGVAGHLIGLSGNAQFPVNLIPLFVARDDLVDDLLGDVAAVLFELDRL